MVPGGKISRSGDILPGAKYVGILAFFRKPDPNYWRCLVSLDQTEQEPEVAPVAPVAAPAPAPAPTPAAAAPPPPKASAPPPAGEAAQRKNKRGRKAFEPADKAPEPAKATPPQPAAKPAETKPPAPAASAAKAPPKAAPKKPGTPNSKVNLVFKVEDCYLKILNLKPELIPGQPENEKPDCGSDAAAPQN